MEKEDGRKKGGSFLPCEIPWIFSQEEGKERRRYYRNALSGERGTLQGGEKKRRGKQMALLLLYRNEKRKKEVMGWRIFIKGKERR